MLSTANSHAQGAKSRRDVLKLAREQNVRYVRLTFADILGVNKNVVVPVSELEAALDGKVTFDGGSIDGFVRDQEADMILRPDLGTFAVYPWTRGGAVEARLICDIATPDGEPFEGCPRTTLRRELEDSAGVLRGLTSAMEVEFYLFDAAAGLPSTATRDAGSYFDFPASDRGEDARTAIVVALEAMGFGISSAHHEHGAGQHEIDFKPAEILRAADQLFTFRSVAKHVATGLGLHATFMPKPLEVSAGSGLHVYFQWSGEPGDESDDAPEGLSRTPSDDVLFAVGGLLEHAPAATAVCNPTVNSYKRLVAAWDAPIYTVWSERSANALVRVPNEHGGRLIEMRSPDPSCNPYLALAVLVASIAHGVRAHRLPGSPLVGTTYDLTQKVRVERGIRVLPKSLRQALDELDKDPIVRGALGDHIYHAFRDAKFAEYERYRRAVHPWEHDAYLRMY
jgi:glutamine synthetase